MSAVNPEFLNTEPQVDETAWIADTATVIGDVKIGANSTVWFGAVIRGDSSTIKIGDNVNVQDLSVIHSNEGGSVVIGDNVTIGHNAVIHGCTIGDHSLIGMGAILLDDAVIGKNCMVAAGALVTGGTVVPDNSLIMGSPAKIIKPLSETQQGYLDESIPEYVELGRLMKSGAYKQARTN